MPRDDAHPPILIAISWQALGRAHDGRAETLLADCTVVILFATFFIEANLNYLIRRMGRTADMRAFFKGRHVGLGDKLAWFYNEYGARARVTQWGHPRWKSVHRNVRTRFPGFAKLYRFRNDLSHGVVNSSARSLIETKRLRQRAKDIVGDLYKLAAKAGHPVRQPTNYQKAIGLK